MAQESSDDEVAGALQEAAEPHDSLEAGRVLSAVRANLFGAEPARFGRFVVLERLGAGATAVVYAGYDPELDRRVAIKVLKRHGRSERLLREAKAMARLRHPHVVGVHQLGTEGDRVFVAMEHVDGSTLGAWLQAADRPWEEIVDVFLEAGEGLAAAHEAELVHRDFKPDNLLVDARGQARVADFGLARLAEEKTRPLDLDAIENETLTVSGALIGTPAYMAPEIFAGEAADERSDQFSFCVTLFEALFGQRPFQGDGLKALAEAIGAGRITPPPDPKRVPRRVADVVERGLRARDDRYPSMAALVEALRAARARGRRRRWAAAAGGLALAAAVTAYAWPASPALCQASDQELAGIWDAPRRAATERAFADTGLGYAGDVFATTARRLDRYAADWIAMHRDTCAATHIRGEQSEAVLDLRMQCLARRRASLRALADILADPNPAVVQRAAEAADGLDDLRGCADVEALTSGGRIPDAPALRAPVEELREELTKCEQIRATGRMEDARALAADIHTRAEKLGFRPLLAETTLALARAEIDREKHAEAERRLDEAFALAVATKQDEIAAWAAVEAVHLVGFRRREPQRGHRWAWLARPMVERADATARLRALLLNNEGSVFWVEGELDEVRDRFTRAVEVLVDALGPRHPQVGFARANLGAALRKRGDHAAALEELTLAESIVRESLGEQHPKMGQIINSIGNLYWGTKDYPRAAEYHRRALALKEATLPADHPSLAHSHNNLADALIETPARDEAETHYREALTRWEAAHGDGYPLLAFPLRGLGRIALARGDGEAAVASLERALALVEKEGSQGPERAETEWHLARALADRDPGRARRLAESAAARFEALGPTQAEPAREVRAWLERRAGVGAAPGQQPPPEVSTR